MKPHHPTRRQVLAAGLAATWLAAPSLARAAAPTTHIGGPAFGTWWGATLPAGTDTAPLQAGIEQALARIDLLMSPWRPDSALSRFNAHRGTDWLRLDPEAATVARAALALRGLSGGAFDPSVGPLVARWGFGPIDAEMPPAGTGFRVTDDALGKDHPDLTLDLCGIAKGHALDRIASLLRDRGQRDFVIDLGGEIAAHGRHPDGRGWQVAVEDPRPGHDGAAEAVTLDGRAIATSGDKVNGYMLAGRRYSHVIDPQTGAPVEGGTASVSVIAADAMTADGWATALMAAGDAGPLLAARNDLDALFLIRDGAGLRRVSTGRFDDHLA